MKKLFLLTLVVLFVFSAASAFAQNGNPCPGEKEYQVNIIGVPNGKNPDMTGNNGHRIFVPLNGPAKVYMTGDLEPATTGLQCGDSFFVADANGTDADGAKLVVPCTPVNATSTSPGVCFDVYATPLGTPGGKADVNVVCEFDSTVVVDPTTYNMCYVSVLDFSLVRNGGKPVQKDITPFLRASGCFDTNATGTCDSGEKAFNNVWIFNLEALEDYYWYYDNQGLRVAMIRFCASTDCGSITTIP